MSLQVVPRMLATLVVAGAVLLALGAVLPGFDVASTGAGIGFAASPGCSTRSSGRRCSVWRCP